MGSRDQTFFFKRNFTVFPFLHLPGQIGTDAHGQPAHGTYSRNQLVGPALNVTVLAGETALLACLAPHLGDKTVKFIFF